MRETLELRGSRRLCGRICRQSKSSFLVSFALLDGPRRKAMCALYAFARLTDDLGDSQESVELRTIQLAQWREWLWQYCDGKEGDNVGRKQRSELSIMGQPTIWPALRDCVVRYHVPVKLLDDIIAGVCMDVQPQQPRDWIELEHYCYHVASSVGLCCAYIWRNDCNAMSTMASHSPIPNDISRAAIDCGQAFQMTNILRDISEDARNGRIYIPQTLFASFDVDRQGWLAAQPTGQWEAMLDEIAGRARQLYSTGWPTIEALTPQSQRMFSLMWRSYRGLLERIAVDKSRLWDTRRIRLPQRQRWGLLTTHFVTPMYAKLSPPSLCP